MSYIEAIVLGAIQGLTEFLPVSSSGHLIFVPKFLGWADQGLEFDTIVHLGTLAAVIIFSRAPLMRIIRGVVSEKEEEKKFALKMIGTLVLTTVPAAAAGLFFGDCVEVNLRAAWVVGVTMIFWGIILGVGDWYSSRVENKSLGFGEVGAKKGLFIGLAQALALIPGSSRSGLTMTAGLFAGLSRQAAAEYSFLASIPIIALAGGKQLLDIILGDKIAVSGGALMVGFLSSLVSGLLALWVLRSILKRGSFKPFVVYRIIVGIAILLIL